jgi:AbiV family abortive infection protein
MSTPVSTQYLLEGAVYSIEHCGQLLRDAILLYRNDSYATAVAVALFAREELGQWDILLNLRREVVDGAILTIDDVRKRCNEHVVKQQAGMMSLTMRADTGTTLGKLLQTRTAGHTCQPDVQGHHEAASGHGSAIEKPHAGRPSQAAYVGSLR